MTRRAESSTSHIGKPGINPGMMAPPDAARLIRGETRHADPGRKVIAHEAIAQAWAASRNGVRLPPMPVVLPGMAMPIASNSKPG